MSKPDETRLSELALQCVQDSEKWFGDMASSKDIVHMALAYAGEVGEFCNIVKKIQRGSLNPNDAKVRFDLAMELVDGFIYMLNLAGMLQIDLDKAYQVKRADNNRRFLAERSERMKNARSE